MKDKQEELETKKIQAEIKKDNQEKTSWDKNNFFVNLSSIVSLA
jgi:hypothetical protein